MGRRVLNDNRVERGISGGFTLPAGLAAIRAMIAAAEHGYYSTFVMQTHPARFSSQGLEDFAREWATAIWSDAAEKGVPMISAATFLDFVEARTAAGFSNVTWNGPDLGFELKVPVAGQALAVMVRPARLRSVRVDGASAAYTTDWLMGRDYALVTTAAARARFVASYDAS